MPVDFVFGDMRLFTVVFALLLVHPVHAANLTSGGPPSNTGELTQSLPLPLPPGVGGVGPSLSFVYSHRGGPGELGFGWSLPVSSIVLDRSTPDPLRDPTWRLDGVELVHGAAGDLAPRYDDGRVVRFKQGTTGRGFEVLDRDGWLFEYGLDGGLTEACSLGPCVALEAKLTAARDPHGLWVRYGYDSLQDAGRQYLTEVEWTLDPSGHPVGPDRWVHITYRRTDETWIDRRAVTRERTHVIDRIDVHVDGERVRSVTADYEPTHDGGVVLTKLEEIGAGEQPKKRPWAEFEYSSDGLNWSGWQDTLFQGGCDGVVQVSGEGVVTADRFDLTGDGVTDFVTAENGYLSLCSGDLSHAPGLAQDPSFHQHLAHTPNHGLIDLEGLRDYGLLGVDTELIDFDGDGHLDRVRRGCAKGSSPCRGVLLLQRRVGMLKWGPEEDVTPLGWSAVPEWARGVFPAEQGENFGLVDLTGDGLPDWVETDTVPGMWVVWRNDGEGFLGWQLWTAPMPDLSYTPPIYEEIYTDLVWALPQQIADSHDTERGLADVTGDGILDAIERESGCRAVPGRFCDWIVYPGTGYGFEAPYRLEIPFERPAGMTDAFPVRRTYPPICWSTQTGPIGLEFSPCVQPDPEVDRRGIHLTDLDGDGMDDLVFGDEVAFNVAGRRFEKPVFGGLPSEVGFLSGPIWGLGEDTVDGRYQDHDGDGFVDFVTGDGWSEAVDSGHRLPPNIMTAAILPTGGRIEYRFEPAVGTATDTERRTPGVSDPTGPLWVLTQVLHSRSDVGNLAYEYRGPVAMDRSLLGFEEVTVIAADKSSQVLTFEVGSPDLGGRRNRVEQRAADGSTLSVRETNWMVLPGTTSEQIRVRPRSQTDRLVGAGGDELVSARSSAWDPLGRLAERQSFDDDGQLLSTTSYRHAVAPHPHDPSLTVDRLLQTESFDPTGARTARTELTWTPMGELEKRSSWLDTDGLLHPESWKHDAFGYVEQHTDLEGDVVDVRWTADYASVDVSIAVDFPAVLHMPPNMSSLPTVVHTRSTGFDLVTGRAVHSQTFSDTQMIRQSRVELDGFGRPVRSFASGPDSPALRLTTEAWYHPTEQWSRTRSRNYDSAGGPSTQADTLTFLDEFGRVEQSRTEAAPGGIYSVQWLERDPVGRVVRASTPILEPGSQPTSWGALTWSETDPSADGRTTSSWLGGLTAGETDGLTIQTWDVPWDGAAVLQTESRHSATSNVVDEAWIDGAGRLDRLVDAEGNETSYAYDLAGRLAAVEDAAGNASWFGYDSWGRRTSMVDPDLSQCGSTQAARQACAGTFEYSLGGALVSRTDSMGRELEWGYDQLGRVGWATGGCESSPGAICADPSEGTSFFFYDGNSPEPGHGAWELGAMTHVVDPSGSTDRRTDHWGRVLSESRELAGSTFRTAQVMDAWGQLEVEGLSVNGVPYEPLHHVRDPMGRLQELVGAWSGVDWIYSVDYDQLDGAVTGWRSVGGVVQNEREYGHDGRLQTLVGQVGFGPAAKVLLDLELDYDAAGRVATKLDLTSSGGPAQEEFGYDLLGRLTTISGATAGYDRDYAYDAIGNMVWSSLWLDAGDGSYDYPDPGEAGPHAVTSIGAHSGFEYDKAGAVTSRWRMGTEQWTRDYGYGQDGRLRSTTHTDDDTGIVTRTSGLLDAFKQRVVKQTTVDGVPTSTVLRPNSRIEVRDGVPIRTIWAGGQRIAETDAAVPTHTDTATFFFTDHQNQQVAAATLTDLPGSAHLVTSSVVRRDPFGVALEGDESLLSRSVAGGEVEATGETYLGWRLYDAEVGRFLQADSLTTPMAGMGQGLNRYRYGWNSPTNFTDPSGYYEGENAVAPLGEFAGVVSTLPGLGAMAGISGLAGFDGTSGPRMGCAFGQCWVQGAGADAGGNQEGMREHFIETCVSFGDSYAACAAWYDSGNKSRSRAGDDGGDEDDSTTVEEIADWFFDRAAEEYALAEGMMDAWLDKGLDGEPPTMRDHIAFGDILLDTHYALKGDPDALRAAALAVMQAVIQSKVKVPKGGRTGKIYRVKGKNTPSGKPYVGRTKQESPARRGKRDGRDRSNAEVVDTYDPETAGAGAKAEQGQMNKEGGLSNLDNKRNEIRESKWKDNGVDPPNRGD